MKSIIRINRHVGFFSGKRNTRPQKLNAYVLFCFVVLTILTLSLVLSGKAVFTKKESRHVEVKFSPITNKLTSYENYVRVS